MEKAGRKKIYITRKESKILKKKSRRGKLNENRFTDIEWLRMNNFEKGKYKIGQVIKSEEDLINNLYKIDKVVDKGKYNMYIAKNIKFGWTLTITDKDDYEIVE